MASFQQSAPHPAVASCPTPQCYKAPAGLFLLIGPGKVRWALRLFLENFSRKSGLGFWISDEGWLYPLAIPEEARKVLILTKANLPKEVWNFGLEAVQSGLFSWVFLHPSQACGVPFLRKLQLACEKRQTLCLLLFKTKLPHWVFTQTLEVSHETHSLPSKLCR